MKAKIKKNKGISRNTDQFNYLAVGLIFIGAALGSDKLLKAAENYTDNPKVEAAKLCQDFQYRLDKRIQEIKQNPAYADKADIFDLPCQRNYDTTLQNQEEKMEFMQDIYLKTLKETIKHSDFYKQIRNNITRRMLLGMEPSEAERVSELRKPTRKTKNIEKKLSTSLNLKEIDSSGRLIFYDFGPADRIKLGIDINASREQGIRVSELNAVFEKFFENEGIYASLGIENNVLASQTRIDLSLTGDLGKLIGDSRKEGKCRWSAGIGYRTEGNKNSCAGEGYYINLGMIIRN